MLPSKFQKSIDAYNKQGINLVEFNDLDSETLQFDSISIKEYVHRYVSGQRLPNCEHTVEFGSDTTDTEEQVFGYDDLDVYERRNQVADEINHAKSKVRMPTVPEGRQGVADDEPERSGVNSQLRPDDEPEPNKE